MSKDYRKLTLAQVKALAKQKPNHQIEVVLFPSLCGPANTTWVQGTTLTIHADKQPTGKWTFHVPTHEDYFTSLDAFINTFRYYNCSKELGKRVHYYYSEPEAHDLVYVCDNCHAVYEDETSSDDCCADSTIRTVERSEVL